MTGTGMRVTDETLQPLTGEQRYRQAMKKARLIFQRDLRQCESDPGFILQRCGMDRERDAIIAEFDRLIAALGRSVISGRTIDPVESGDG